MKKDEGSKSSIARILTVAAILLTFLMSATSLAFWFGDLSAKVLSEEERKAYVDDRIDLKLEPLKRDIQWIRDFLEDGGLKKCEE